MRTSVSRNYALVATVLLVAGCTVGSIDDDPQAQGGGSTQPKGSSGTAGSAASSAGAPTSGSGGQSGGPLGGGGTGGTSGVAGSLGGAGNGGTAGGVAGSLGGGDGNTSGVAGSLGGDANGGATSGIAGSPGGAGNGGTGGGIAGSPGGGQASLGGTDGGSQGGGSGAWGVGGTSSGGTSSGGRGGGGTSAGGSAAGGKGGSGGTGGVAIGGAGGVATGGAGGVATGGAAGTASGGKGGSGGAGGVATGGVGGSATGGKGGSGGAGGTASGGAGGSATGGGGSAGFPSSNCSEANKTVTGNGTGKHCNYTYEYWKDSGNGTLILTPDGFSLDWSGINDLLGRKGLRPGSANLVVNYQADYQPNGNSYLCVYGWTRNPLVEYYIVESWGNWRPPGAGYVGTVTSDGGSYDTYKISRNGANIDGNGAFTQYWSVRTSKKTSGVITIGNHFNAWKNSGMPMGSFYEVSMTVEGYQSSGKADVKFSMQ